MGQSQKGKARYVVCQMCDLPFGGGDACYATVLEHDGDLDEGDCEVIRWGNPRVPATLGSVVLLVSGMLTTQRTDFD